MQHALFSGLIGGIVAFAINYWLLRRSGRAQAVRDAYGWRHVRYPLGYRALAVVCALIALFMLLAASRARADQVVAARLVTTSLALGAIWMLYEMFLRGMRFDAVGFQSLHPVLTRSMAFKDVIDCQYIDGVGCVRITGSDGRRFWIPLAAGSKTLSRYGRRLQRMALMRNVFARRSVEIDVLGADDGTAAGSFAHMLSLDDHERLLINVDTEDAWTLPRNQQTKRIVLVLRGEARLTYQQFDWTLRPGNVVTLPEGLPSDVAFAGLAGGPARLVVLKAPD